MPVLYGIAAATASFLLAALLAGLLRAPALRLALLDRRRRRPVPLLGGVAVVLVTGLVAWAGDGTGVVPLGPAVGRLLVAATAVGARSASPPTCGGCGGAGWWPAAPSRRRAWCRTR